MSNIISTFQLIATHMILINETFPSYQIIVIIHTHIQYTFNPITTHLYPTVLSKFNCSTLYLSQNMLYEYACTFEIIFLLCFKFHYEWVVNINYFRHYIINRSIIRCVVCRLVLWMYVLRKYYWMRDIIATLTHE